MALQRTLPVPYALYQTTHFFKSFSYFYIIYLYRELLNDVDGCLSDPDPTIIITDLAMANNFGSGRIRIHNTGGSWR